ncbi:MAG: prepilin-type cleavage/methylation domain-containing protein [Methylotenera sp.]
MMKNISSTRANMQKMHKQPGLQQQGAVLLEALIAVLIFSFGILAISGLQGAMMKNTADATYRAEASYIVQQRIGAMLVDPIALGGGSYPVASLPAGNLTITPLSASRLQFVVNWQVPGEAQHKYEAVTTVFTAR